MTLGILETFGLTVFFELLDFWDFWDLLVLFGLFRLIGISELF